MGRFPRYCSCFLLFYSWVRQVDILQLSKMYMGGFRGGAEGGVAPPFFLVFSKCFWKVSITLLLHVLKSEVFIRREGGGGRGEGGGLGPPLSEFSGFCPDVLICSLKASLVNFNLQKSTFLLGIPTELSSHMQNFGLKIRLSGNVHWPFSRKKCTENLANFTL